jgi:hypothetical protein
MKVGKEVWVCHDGKWGRRVKGIILARRKCHHIKILFTPESMDDPVEFWARRRPKVSFNQNSRGSYIHHGKRSPNTYGGWADIDMWAPWFSVYEYKKSEELGSN